MAEAAGMKVRRGARFGSEGVPALVPGVFPACSRRVPCATAQRRLLRKLPAFFLDYSGSRTKVGLSRVDCSGS